MHILKYFAKLGISLLSLILKNSGQKGEARSRQELRLKRHEIKHDPQQETRYVLLSVAW